MPSCEMRRALAFLLAFCSASCNLSHQPVFLEQRRPAGVSAKAVLVPGPKGGWWQVCDPPVDRAANIWCSIYNWGGETLYAELFVAVDQNGIDRHEVQIDPAAKLVGSSWINLKGGRILVPGSRAAELRRFLMDTSSK